MTEPTTRGRLVGQSLVIGISAGIATGLLELALMAVRRALFGHWFLVSRGVTWMAPLGTMLFFAVVVTAVAAGVAIVRPRWTVAATTFAVVLMASMSAVLMLPVIAEQYGLILGLGLAVQGARLAARNPAALVRLASRAIVPLAATTLLFAGVVEAAARWREWRAVRALPAAPNGAPNVLLVVLDTGGADWMSTYGYDRPTTPELTELATRGVLFERAYTVASWTLPSHASMFTGRYAFELEADWWVPLDQGDPTLAERFAARGYRTGGFVANYGFATPDFGLSRGFGHYEGVPATAEEIVMEFALGRRLTSATKVRRLLDWTQLVNRKSAAEVNQELLRWLGGVEHRPFFAFLNYFDVHAPYIPPAPYDSLFGVTPRKFHAGNRAQQRMVNLGPKWRAQMTPAEQAYERRAYEGSLAYLDHQLGRLFDTLATRGLLDNTIVVVTGDHGEMLGDFGHFLHGYDLYLPVLRVPLIIRFPRHAPENVRITEPVTLRDLAATIADLADLAPDSTFPGSSLAAHWDNDSTTRSPSPIIAYHTGPPGVPFPSISVIRDGHQLIRDVDGKNEVFDIIRDPLAGNDLSKTPTGSAIAVRLGAVIDSANLGRLLQKPK